MVAAAEIKDWTVLLDDLQSLCIIHTYMALHVHVMDTDITILLLQ